jgi:hypothetical protein
MGQQIRVEMLDKLDPSRAARGDHGQYAAGFDPFQQFMAFFDNGQVGREIGVKHPVKSQTSQGRDHLSGDQVSGGHTELFSQLCPDGGRFLDHHMQGRVLQGRPDPVCVVFLPTGPCGADHGALAAVGAGGVCQAMTHGRHHPGSKPPSFRGEQGDPLDICTHGDTAQAVDALAHVPDQNVRGIIDIV